MGVSHPSLSPRSVSTQCLHAVSTSNRPVIVRPILYTESSRTERKLRLEGYWYKNDVIIMSIHVLGITFAACSLHNEQTTSYIKVKHR